MARQHRSTGALGMSRTTFLLAVMIGGALLGTTVAASMEGIDQPARVDAQAVRFSPPPPPPTTVVTSHQRSLDAMLDAINVARVAAGVAPVQRHPLVELAAQGHADEMAARRQMTHSGSDGSDAGDRLLAVGFAWSGWAENVGAGFVDPAVLVQSWMASSAHRRNMLGDYAFIGVGVATSSDGVQYWTLDLANG